MSTVYIHGMSYTKLFREIIHSTIWHEPDHIRITWVTMLAMRDENHEVRSSIPGLASISGVTLDQCLEALEKLSSPDPYSRSQEHEGRRIKEVRGGWLILNGQYYQELQSNESRRSYKRLHEENRRLKEKIAKRIDQKVHESPRCPQSPEMDEMDTVDKSRVDKSKVNKSTNTQYWAEMFKEFWKLYPKKRGKGAAETAWKKIKPSKDLVDIILDSVKNHTKCPDWLKEGGRFIPNPATFLNQKRWEDEPDSGLTQAFRTGAHNHQKKQSEVDLAIAMVDEQERQQSGKRNN